MSDALKALQYAEENLGVNKVFEELTGYLNDLDVSTSDLDKALDAKRELEEEYADAEVDLVNEKRGLHPEMSDTKFRQELKIWERENDRTNTLRIQLNAVKSEIQGLEFDQAVLKARITVGSARLTELGGYLNYLTAVKNQAENAKKKTQEKA